MVKVVKKGKMAYSAQLRNFIIEDPETGKGRGNIKSQESRHVGKVGTKGSKSLNGPAQSVSLRWHLPEMQGLRQHDTLIG